MSKKKEKKDPIRYKSILHYENSFKKNFSIITKSILVDIKKELKKDDTNTTRDK